MKKSLLFACAVLTAMAVSCSTEKDESLPAPASAASRPVAFTTDVQPFLRKSCTAAHCHGVIARTQVTSKESLSILIGQGRFQNRIFELGASTPCGNINMESLTMLKSWVADGALME